MLYQLILVVIKFMTPPLSWYYWITCRSL